MLNKVQDQLHTLSTRERAILFVTIIILLAALWNNLFYETMQRKLTSDQESLAAARLELKTQEQIAQQFESQKISDPNLNNKNQLVDLQIEHDQLQQQLNLGGKKFLPPQLMAAALGDILSQNRQLDLIKLTNLPVKPLLPTEQQEHPIYIHGLAITFKGNYIDTVNYLKSLEQLPWHFKWDSIDYQVKSYPTAETTVQVYTLSFEESWLGI